MAFGAQAAQAQAAAGERLFITKIPQTISKEDITTYFSRFGTTMDVYVPSVPGSHTHKGIAFVSFADAASVQLTMGHCPHEINGFEVVVDVAAPRGEGGGKGGFQAAHAPAPQAFEAPAEAEATTDRLFVTKVSPQLNKEHLREYFSQYGDLTDVYMPQAPGATTHKGICFLQFTDPMSCQGVLLNGPHEIQGSPVIVDVAASKGAGKGNSKQAMNRAPAAPVYGGHGKAGGGYDAGFAAGLAAARGGGGGFAAGGTPAKGGFKGGASKGGAEVSGRLFITRVNPEVTKDDLQAYFQQFGMLQDVYVPPGKGIAFVSFADPSCAQRVLQNPQHEVKPGQTVVCDQAVEKSDKGKGKAKGFSPY